MKKVVILLLGCIVGFSVNAQNPAVVSAYNYLRNQQLDKAKTNIDAASVHVQTSGNAKTWFYRGNIYLSIYLNPKFKSLDPNPLQVAYDSYQKSIEIDKEYVNADLNPPNAMVGLYVVGEQFYNQGVDLYNNKDYSGALDKFEMTRKINASFGAKDTIATFNAALCAMQLEDNAKAKLLLEDLAKNQYHHALVYSSLSNIYKNEGDSVKAMAIITKGRKLMGDDLSLIIAEVNIYLSQNKSAEAQNLLNIAIEKDPNNPLLHYAIGVNYAEFNDFDRAEKSYKKAIELKADYFDAIYNLGALYNNTAALIMEEANKLPVDATEEYDKLKAKADEMLANAIPILEKALELNPSDMNTLISLKQLYTRTSDFDKLKIIDEKIENLRGQ